MSNVYVNSREDLERIKEEFLHKESGYLFKVLICSGAGCISSDCHNVKASFIQAVEEFGLTDKVRVVETGCIGTCDIGPVMVVFPSNVMYTKLDPKSVKKIVESHLVNGNIVIEKTYFDKVKNIYVPYFNEIEYFKKQVKIALRNCGSIDYSSLEEYIANDGYMALAKVLYEYTPQSTVDEVKKSGLRGRGGGGFPTGIKWEAGLKAPGKEKIVVCNADEGDPGAFMDRSILEGDAHTVIEGMAIAGFAIGANKGYVYVRAEYPIAVERLEIAIKKAREAGLLGKNIMGKGFDFDIEVRIGAGAFVCGEETALMASIEGERGEPRQKPPLPFEKGIFGKPTIINNVETFANVPPIILKGSEWFASFGTEKSKGTKVFALAGDINNTGIVEVPMGISLGDILFDIGGGIPKKKKFKAAQTGGPSGGCITTEYLNTPIDYDSLTNLGAIMGSGGLISMDDDTCMVDMAKFFMEFVQEESCGKCTPCRVGTKRMLEILERITNGEGREGDIELLEELGQGIMESAICGLGQTAPKPVLSTIKHFRHEYEEHIKHKYCRAGVCAELVAAPCQNACPANVNVPGYIALVAAGRLKEAYELIRQENPLPAVCGRVCTHPCESKCRRSTLDDPIAIRELKRYAADHVLKHEKSYAGSVMPLKKTGKKVSIIGAGPSGLTCGYYLANLGHDVEIYEQHSVAGGMLAFGIPEYRLPMDILAAEVKLIEDAGVKIHLNTEVGKDISFSEIREKSDAVYISTGTQFSRKIGVPGEDMRYIHHGLDYLRDVNLGKTREIGKKVVVIGGGSTATDAARVALRNGAEEVTILYRRQIEDMPAEELEITECIEEGVKIIPLVAPVCFLDNGKGGVTIECVKMKLGEFDSSGRRKPVKKEEERFTIDADAVIAAVSQYSDLPFIDKCEVEVTSWGSLVSNKDTMMTKLEGVFAGGDVVRGPDVVITAIADGKKAASAIDIYLGGKGELNKGEPIEIPMGIEEEEIVEHERFDVKYLDPAYRKNNFEEVSQGFHKLNAVAESMRCLRCDRRV